MRARRSLTGNRLKGYLDLLVPSFFLAGCFGKCLTCAVLEGMFPWGARYPLSRCRSHWEFGIEAMLVPPIGLRLRAGSRPGMQRLMSKFTNLEFALALRPAPRSSSCPDLRMLAARVQFPSSLQLFMGLRLNNLNRFASLHRVDTKLPAMT